jgi:hypothetical protein
MERELTTKRFAQPPLTLEFSGAPTWYLRSDVREIERGIFHDSAESAEIEPSLNFLND